MPFRSLNFKVGLDLGNVKRGFSRIDRLAGKTARTMRGVFSAAATGATALAAGITLAAGAYLKLNQQVADSKNQLLDASTRTGIAAETLSGLRLAAEGSGLEFKALEGTLGRFTKTMNDAAEGLTEAQRGFQALGVEAVDSEGNVYAAEGPISRETAEGGLTKYLRP